MRQLFLRELRRLLPYGAAPLLLSILLAGWLYSFKHNSGAPEFWRALLACGSTIIPLALGVAAVAPDSSAGGVAFLARLPLSPGRVLATKVAAALAWITLALGLSLPFVIHTAQDGSPVAALAIPMALVCALGAFGVGLLTSVVAHRTMPALLLAPCLAIFVCLVGLGVPYAALGIALEPPLFVLFTLSAGLTCSLLAFLSYAYGDRHRRSTRPALIGIGGLLGALGVGLLSITAAHAYTVERVGLSELRIMRAVDSPTHGRVAVETGVDLWTGLERRVAVISRPGGKAWVLPMRHASAPSFSPDGRQLLLSSAHEPGGWLVDLERRQILPMQGRTKEGFGYDRVVWRKLPNGYWPLLLRTAGQSLQTFAAPPGEGRTERPHYFASFRLGTEQFLAGVRGEQLLVADQHTLFSCAPPEPGVAPGELQRVRDWVHPCLGAYPSPQGRYVVAVAAGPCGTALPPSQGSHVVPSAAAHHLDVYDLEQGGDPLSLFLEDSASIRLDRSGVSFSPSERFVAFRHADDMVSVFELASGKLLARLGGATGSRERGPAQPVAWSPGETRVATATGEVASLVVGEKTSQQLRHLVAFFDETTVIPLSYQLDWLDWLQPDGGL